MRGLILCAVLGIVLAEFLNSKNERRLDGYRFQYHDDTGHYLVIKGLDCYVADVPVGSTLQTKLQDNDHLDDLERKVIGVVESGTGLNRVDLKTIVDRYQDTLTRALCFRSTMYIMDLSGKI
ncbi:hypothetical protein SNE40_015390 [Patella caerulea]|uniref:Uncharacterized protein n=1 Tax=Patella caerulea TaxID=87958 RepID=A0AAN8JFL2_PATCE